MIHNLLKQNNNKILLTNLIPLMFIPFLFLFVLYQKAIAAMGDIYQVSSPVINHMHVDSTNDYLYISLKGGGLLVIDTKGTADSADDVKIFNYSVTSNPAIPSNDVISSTLDKTSGLLFICTTEGVTIIDTKNTDSPTDDILISNFTEYSLPISIVKGYSYTTDFDFFTKRLYIGISAPGGKGGVFSIDLNTLSDPTDDILIKFYSKKSAPAIGNNYVYQVKYDNSKNILFVVGQGSSDEGALTIVNLNNNTSFSYNNNGVYDTTDGSNWILISSNPSLGAGGARDFILIGDLLYISHYCLNSAVTVIDTNAGGLGLLDPSDDVIIQRYGKNTVPAISSNFSGKTYYDSSTNYLYIGTIYQSSGECASSGGLNIIDLTTNTRIGYYHNTSTPRLPGSNVYNIFVDTHGIIYISTGGAGYTIDTKGTPSQADDELATIYTYVYQSNYTPPDTKNFWYIGEIFGPAPAGSGGTAFGLNLKSGDINGDGYSDIVTSNFAYALPASNTGATYIFTGKDNPSYNIDISIKGEAGNDYMGDISGASVDIGNINNDNFDDLVIGAMGSDSFNGKIYVFLGKSNWESNTNPLDANFFIYGNGTDRKFLSSSVLTTGDINNDSYDEIAANSINQVQIGLTLYIYNGGIPFDNNHDTYIHQGPSGNYTEFSLKGDFNGDGYNDALVGFYWPFRYHFYLGGTNFNTNVDVILPSAFNSSTNTIPSLSIGDINSDGISDICTSSYTSSDYLYSSGQVYCYYGSSSWVDGTVTYISRPDITLNPQNTQDGFGRTTDLYDLTNDGLEDLIVGVFSAPENRWQGEVYIYRNNCGSFDSTPLFIIGDYKGKRSLGREVLGVDYNGDGWGEIFITEGGSSSSGVGNTSINFYEIKHGVPNIKIDPINKTNSKKPSIFGNAKNDKNIRSRNEVSKLLDLGIGNNWDTAHTGYSPSVLHEGNIYKVWYAGSNISNYRIGYATSPDGVNWTKAPNNCGLTGDGCVFNLGIANSFDDAHIYGVSVINDGGIYKMWYSGHDGSYLRIGYATSPDGINWTRYDNPSVAACGFSEAYDDGCVFNRASNTLWDDYHVAYPKVIKENGIYKMWYSGHDGSKWRIGYAESLDGISWTRANVNFCNGMLGTGCVLDVGNTEMFDNNGVLTGEVIKTNGVYKMLYSGNNGLIWQIGYAQSTDGINWSKDTNNPLIPISQNIYDIDKGHTYLNSLIYEEGIYKTWYSAHDGANVRLAYATSPDMQTWNKYTKQNYEEYTKNISFVNGKIDDGDWFYCSATDGSYNSTDENFICIPPEDLSDGAHTLHVRFRDTNYLYIPERYYASEEFLVDTICAPPHITDIGLISGIPDIDELNYYFTS